MNRIALKIQEAKSQKHTHTPLRKIPKTVNGQQSTINGQQPTAQSSQPIDSLGFEKIRLLLSDYSVSRIQCTGPNKPLTILVFLQAK